MIVPEVPALAQKRGRRIESDHSRPNQKAKNLHCIALLLEPHLWYWKGHEKKKTQYWLLFGFSCANKSFLLSYKLVFFRNRTWKLWLWSTALSAECNMS